MYSTKGSIGTGVGGRGTLHQRINPSKPAGCANAVIYDSTNARRLHYDE